MQAKAPSQLLAGCLVSLKPSRILAALFWWALVYTCATEGAHPLQLFDYMSIFFEECFSNPKITLLSTPVPSWHHHGDQDALVQVQNKKATLVLSYLSHSWGARDSRNGRASTRKQWYQERRLKRRECTDSAGTCIKFGLEGKKNGRGYGGKSYAFKKTLLKSGTLDLFLFQKIFCSVTGTSNWVLRAPQTQIFWNRGDCQYQAA